MVANLLAKTIPTSDYRLWLVVKCVYVFDCLQCVVLDNWQ